MTTNTNIQSKFTTYNERYEDDDNDFVSDTLDGPSFSSHGFTGADGRAHTATYVHNIERMTVRGDRTGDGAPYVSFAISGDCGARVTLFGASLDMLQAAIDAARQEAGPWSVHQVNDDDKLPSVGFANREVQ